MNTDDIRSVFLDFFGKRSHHAVASAGLVPAGDSTLLFTNAGMVQFKDYFTGLVCAPFPRAVSIQKCVRAGGKHNDLENVGFTARHHTFFEMLGNFSFGDYFKQDAIRWAWEFLTDVVRLDPADLWVSVFREDEEAAAIWHREVGIAEDRIAFLGEKDNFWAMGETGPCGPCSEVLIDLGVQFGCGRPECDVSCECGRYLELWNLVFMQFARDDRGVMTPLPHPSIDTGLGLERIAAVLQDKTNNYDSDLFRPLIRFVEETSGIAYGSNEKHDISMRVIADHARALTFLIQDGVMPSNEWRGYVLRRILRRAMRHARMLGIEEDVLHRVSGEVVDVMQRAYPELVRNRQYLARVIQSEERRFANALSVGMHKLDELVDRSRSTGSTSISGDDIFVLYDTYGFPVDLAEEILHDSGLSFSRMDYEQAMEAQRARARCDWKGSSAHDVPVHFRARLPQLEDYEFLGYETLQADAEIFMLAGPNGEVEELVAGEAGEMIFLRSPFYAEAGGQVGDRGRIEGNPGDHFEVADTVRLAPNLVVHRGSVRSGSFRTATRVRLQVDPARRLPTQRNHTATHLLQAALRSVLGDHVKQSGSYVDAEHFRFDFTHFSAVGEAELRRVEELVNSWILQNRRVHKETKDFDEALREGAIAIFDEKYGDRVRVVWVADISRELCGGTHVDRTGDIGSFAILSEGSVAAGIRRIEGITGEGAFHQHRKLRDTVGEITDLLRAGEGDLVARVRSFMEHQKKLEKELEKARAQAAGSNLDEILASRRMVKDIAVYTGQLHDVDMKSLLALADRVRNRIASGVAVLGSDWNEKVFFVVLVSKDLVHRLHAGRIVGKVASITGGGGGGRPELAQAGGRQPGKLPDAINRVPEIVLAFISPESVVEEGGRNGEGG